jgi:Spy/CpxP family protein refolding chaperone
MTSSEPSAPRSIRLLTALLLVAMFASGTLTGAALTLWVRPDHHGPPGPPPFGPLPIDELGLSPEQQRRADAIFERHRPELDAILQEGFPKVRKVNDQIESEIREILTPEQRTRLDELKARRPQQRHHHRGGPGGRLGGPFLPGPPPDDFGGPPPQEPPPQKTQ